ncbi:MAG: methyltransferase domain-containing protein [Vagococcus sp.]|uniref:methyltransferase domain-containing protein n=1 Tax=Vagococcus sp. TaxID=1933889 RepID=UPI002FC6F437
MRKYLCDTCHFIYDEQEGDSKNGVPRETLLEELAGSLCNRCQMKDLNRYSVLFSEYQKLEATYYSMFSGKWHVHHFLSFLSEHKLSSPSILDVGVGHGRSSFPLVSEGFLVTGLEKSPAMVTVLQRQKWTSFSHFDLVTSDIFDYQENKTFDVILLADTTFQELVYQKCLKHVLEKLANLLSPEGFIWIETTNVAESQHISRKKDIDLKRSIHLDSEIIKKKHHFTYNHTFELFNEGTSSERQFVSRNLPSISVKDIDQNLPSSLKRVSCSLFPTERKEHQSEQLDRWLDGGYPVATSNPLAKKEIIILEKIEEF